MIGLLRIIKNIEVPRFVFVAVVVLCASSGCSDEQAAQATDTPTASAAAKPQVTVTTVTWRDYEREISLTGTLRPKAGASLRSLASGPIESVHVDIGDTVTRDQPLAQIRSLDAELAVGIAKSAFDVAKAEWIGLKAWRRDEDMAILRAKVEEAEAKYKERKLEFERSQSLFESATSSESKRDSDEASAQVAKAALEIAHQQLAIAETGPSLAESNHVEAGMAQAEAHLVQARQALSDTTIRAPFDGIITGKHRKVGDYARTGDELLELTDVSVLEADFMVPERFSQVVEPGLKVELEIGDSGLKRTGTISTVNAVVDEHTRTFLVKAEVENSDLRIKGGSFCNGVLSPPSLKSLLSIPRECLHEDEGALFVWTVDEDDRARRVVVRVGARDTKFVAIFSELTEDARIVTSGQGALTEGVEVDVVGNR